MAWQDNQCEQWLQEMARQGLHLKSVNIFCLYTFIQSKPAEVSYCLDFVPHLRRDPAYFDLFRDAGWEHVIEITGWHYWRTPIVAGRVPKIFTDIESKIKKYKRILLILVLGPSPLILLFIRSLVLHSPIEQLATSDKWILGGMFGGLGAFYMYAMTSVGARIRELRRNGQ
ncbi:DUF2812 domain-containing protein [Undibacterium sp. RTI2.1]|uniref:DUF2812 domain-containing protein n=1 Tax=unclassified Undibacterium TaxID=2630295 RepID=UPI002B231B99|nr:MULTISPECIES: DUF2812 domain-containing protein [unclassified Undibacterium]MEB0030698.1 DUF2812 domain-containing protein [Undibacterium sp. RTI2.1]MEB0117183.1 DUF2812 domain-containing protein [Undibacterium sp. RTI2.2]